MEINNVQISKFNQICRTCLNEEQLLTYLYDENDQNDSLIKKLETCTSIQCNKNDGLPDKICPKCIDELFQSYNFAKKCKINDASLKQCLKNRNDNCFETIFVNPDNKDEPDLLIKNEYVDDLSFSMFNKVVKNTDITKIDTNLNSEIIIKEEIEDTTSDDDDEEEEEEMEFINIPKIKIENINYGNMEENETNIELPTTKNPTEETYKCDTCGKVFHKISSLNVHKRLHTGEHLYKCKICEKTFNRSSNLKQHRKIHNNERPHKCETCDKTYTSSSHLKAHKRVHTGERPYKCDTCGKAFNKAGSLKNHKRIHTGERPYKCNTCEKTFAHSSTFIKHQRIHTGERPFKCQICKKAFHEAGTLKVHERIHTGERPYKCQICEKTFIQPGHLIIHKKMHP